MFLLEDASATGDWVPITDGGRYMFSIVGTFSGATGTLQIRGPDGSTAIDVPDGAFTTNGVVAVRLGQGARVRVGVTGGPPSGLYADLKLID